MDDRELEGRLKARLHARFDDAPVPADLADDVRQKLTTATRPVGFSMRSRGVRFGWALGAAAAFAGIALLAASLRLPLTPGGSPRPSSTGVVATSPEPTTGPDRVFVVMSPLLGQPGKDLLGRVSDQLAARIMGLGAHDLSISTGYGIVLTLPPEKVDDPTDDEIRAVLLATGDVQFVPLPPADYGNGKLAAEPGKPLPKDEPSLFGWDGIDSVARRAGYFEPNALIALKPAAADTFAAYTTNHVGEQFAIVVDGVVTLAPRINSPIPTGEIELAAGLENSVLVNFTIAILSAGELPESWTSPTVPQILDRGSAGLAAQVAADPTGVVKSTDVEVIQDGSRWRAVWRVSFEDGVVVTIDAVTGEWLSTGTQ